MTNDPDSATALTLRKPDRFADVREATVAHVGEHGCGLIAATVVEARGFAVFVRATRSSHVLQLGSGLGYTSLHLAAALGRTGRLDVVEPDQTHAEAAVANVRRFALDERVRIHHGNARDVVPALSGPYDLAVLETERDDYPWLFDDLVRLLRTGGSVFAPAGALLPERFLDQLAADERLEAWFGPDLQRVVATRTR